MRATAKCPSCGLLVLRDDEAQTIAHEEPVCDWFDSMAHSGSEAPEVRQVSSEAMPAHLDALRSRVGRKR